MNLPEDLHVLPENLEFKDKTVKEWLNDKGILGTVEPTNLNMSMDSSKREITGKSDPATLLQPGQVNNDALSDLTGNELIGNFPRLKIVIANEEFIKFLYDSRSLVNTCPNPAQAKALADQERFLSMENEDQSPEGMGIPTSQQAKSVVSKGKPAGKAPAPKADAQTINSKEMNESDAKNRTEEVEHAQAILESLWTPNDLVFGFGDSTYQRLLDLVQVSDNIVWFEEICLGLADFDLRFREFEKKICKFLVDKVNGFKQKWEDADEIARISIIKLVISVIGEKLIDSINTFDLKDPPPPKAAKKKEEGTGEEGDEEEDEEDEDEEPEEEEEHGGDGAEDDMDSEQMRNFKPKTNVDQITDIYHPDNGFVLKILGGHFFESNFF